MAEGTCVITPASNGINWRHVVFGKCDTWYKRLASELVRIGKSKQLPCLLDTSKTFAYRYYLVIYRRWWFPFSVVIHQICNSDDPIYHTHEASYFTWILEGGYIEHTTDGPVKRRPGSFRFRAAKTLHYVDLYNGPSWSLFVTGPKTLINGFMHPKGHVRWDSYLFKKRMDKHDVTHWWRFEKSPWVPKKK